MKDPIKQNLTIM